jgi:hypothetical protein
MHASFIPAQPECVRLHIPVSLLQPALERASRGIFGPRLAVAGAEQLLGGSALSRPLSIVFDAAVVEATADEGGGFRIAADWHAVLPAPTSAASVFGLGMDSDDDEEEGGGGGRGGARKAAGGGAGVLLGRAEFPIAPFWLAAGRPHTLVSCPELKLLRVVRRRRTRGRRGLSKPSASARSSEAIEEAEEDIEDVESSPIHPLRTMFAFAEAADELRMRAHVILSGELGAWSATEAIRKASMLLETAIALHRQQQAEEVERERNADTVSINLHVPDDSAFAITDENDDVDVDLESKEDADRATWSRAPLLTRENASAAGSAGGTGTVRSRSKSPGANHRDASARGRVHHGRRGRHHSGYLPLEAPQVSHLSRFNSSATLQFLNHVFGRKNRLQITATHAYARLYDDATGDAWLLTPRAEALLASLRRMNAASAVGILTAVQPPSWTRVLIPPDENGHHSSAAYVAPEAPSAASRIAGSGRGLLQSLVNRATGTASAASLLSQTDAGAEADVDIELISTAQRHLGETQQQSNAHQSESEEKREVWLQVDLAPHQHLQLWIAVGLALGSLLLTLSLVAIGIWIGKMKRH